MNEIIHLCEKYDLQSDIDPSDLMIHVLNRNYKFVNTCCKLLDGFELLQQHVFPPFKIIKDKNHLKQSITMFPRCKTIWQITETEIKLYDENTPVQDVLLTIGEFHRGSNQFYGYSKDNRFDELCKKFLPKQLTHFEITTGQFLVWLLTQILDPDLLEMYQAELKYGYGFCNFCKAVITPMAVKPKPLSVIE